MKEDRVAFSFCVSSCSQDQNSEAWFHQVRKWYVFNIFRSWHLNHRYCIAGERAYSCLLSGIIWKNCAGSIHKPPPKGVCFNAEVVVLACFFSLGDDAFMPRIISWCQSWSIWDYTYLSSRKHNIIALVRHVDPNLISPQSFELVSNFYRVSHKKTHALITAL